MPRWNLLENASVLLLASMSLSLDCHFQRSQGNREILQHLGNLGGHFPLRCLKDRNDFRLLQILKTDQFAKEGALIAKHEALQQIFHTFSLSVSGASWNESSTRTLLSALYQQIQATEECLEQEIQPEGHAFPQRETIRLGLKNYFQGIHHYLQEQKSSSCAWEIVRVEIQRCLSFIEHLIKRP